MLGADWQRLARNQRASHIIAARFTNHLAPLNNQLFAQLAPACLQMQGIMGYFKKPPMAGNSRVSMILPFTMRKIRPVL